MKKTTNYKLNKPELYEQFDINHFNDNADVIDSQMKKNEQAVITESINRDKAIDKAVLAEKKERETADNNIINGVTPVTKVSDTATKGDSEIATVNNITDFVNLKLGTSMNNGTDLNTYTTIGNYFSNSYGSTFINMPERWKKDGSAGFMIVRRILNNNSYLGQEITAYNTGNKWYRYTSDGGKSWTEWTEYATTDTSKATTQTDAFTQTYWNSYETGGKAKNFTTGTYIGTVIEKSTQKYCKFIYSCDWEKNASYTPLEERGLVKDTINSVGTIAFKHTDGSSITNLDCRVIKISDKFTNNLLTKLYSEGDEVATKKDIRIQVENNTGADKYFELGSFSQYNELAIEAEYTRIDRLSDIMTFCANKMNDFYFINTVFITPIELSLGFVYVMEFLVSVDNKVYIRLPSYSHVVLKTKSKLVIKEVTEPKNLRYRTSSQNKILVNKSDLGDQKTFTFKDGILYIDDKK